MFRRHARRTHSRPGRRRVPARSGWTSSLLCSTAALIALCGLVSEADAQPVELKTSLPPVVMIVMDTSGSMEWMPELNGLYPRCSSSCANDNSYGQSQKARTHIITEVMTGTFSAEDYYCCRAARPSGYASGKYDSVPDSVTQATDGVLDIYRDSVKFAIAGFDSEERTQTNAGGMFSYGPSYSGINLGLQNEVSTFSPMVAPPATDDLTSVAAVNETLQTRIRKHVAVGGTPLASALDDAQYFFANHDNVRLGGDDPYAACRERAIILITDGEPTYDACYNNSDSSCDDVNSYYPFDDYLTTPLQAGDIFTTDGIKVHVVGFRTSNAAEAVLEETAMAGGTCDEPGPGCFYEADGYAGLRLAVTSIISELLSGSGARTRAVTTQRTSFRADQPGSYEVVASFEVDAQEPLWTGRLERITWSCDDDGNLVARDPRLGESDAENPTLDFADRLRDQIDAGTRRVLTSDDMGQLVPLDDSGAGDGFLALAAHAADENPFSPACEQAAGDVPLTTVSSSAGYTYYELADAGAYVRDPYECLTDQHCNTADSEDYEVCANGRCQPHGGACNTTTDCCESGTEAAGSYEAESSSVSKNGGFGFSGVGWSLYDNDHTAYVDVNIPASGTYAITVFASQSALGSYDATMRVGVNGNGYNDFTVANESGEFAPFTYTVNLSAGTRRVYVKLRNEYYVNSGYGYYWVRTANIDSIQVLRTDVTTSAGATCNQVCYAGTCETVGGGCSKHSDCGASQVCHLGQCTTGSALMCDLGRWLENQPLADIHHSNPTLGLGPEYDTRLADYKEFRRARGGRDTMIYVGANDGMLHAFLLGALESDVEDEGKELWSFVPMGVYDKLRDLRFGHVDLVDATPVVRDLRMRPRALDPADRWGTVLIGGLRKGGQSWYALDVTDPRNPSLLWEVVPAMTGWEALGYTFGEAAAGSVVLEASDGTGPREQAVAFLPGGASLTPTSSEGAAFYVVDVNTGELLRTFTQFTNADGDVEALAPMTGSPAAWSTKPGELVRRVYTGDARGRLFRLDTSKTDIAEWTFELAFDPTDDLEDATSPVDPVYFAPTLSRTRDGELVIIYGNGNVDELVNAGDANFLASLREVPVLETDGTYSIEVRRNWFTRFVEPGEKLTGAPVVFDKVAWFPTFVPGSGGCDFGHARLYAVDFVTDDGAGDIKEVVNIDIDGDPDVDLYANFASDTVIYGLDVATRPPCYSVEVDGAGIKRLKEPVSTRPQIIVQTGAAPFDPMQTVGAGVSQPSNRQSETVHIDIAPPSTQLRTTSWGAIYR